MITLKYKVNVTSDHNLPVLGNIKTPVSHVQLDHQTLSDGCVKFTIPDLHWQYSLSDLLKLQALDSL